MPSAHPTGHTNRPAPSPTPHPIHRTQPNTGHTQQWTSSPVDSLESPPGAPTAVGSPAPSLRSALKQRPPQHPPFQRQRPKIAVIFADVVGIVIPLGFIAFAIVICKIDGTRTDPSAGYNVRTNSLGPYKDPINIFATAFPIAFAALVGRLITMFIRWKLERGAGIQSLERLLGSRTVGNTVLTMFLLPLSWFTIVILAVWAFSPLGAQSILRILETNMYPVISNITVSYFDTDTNSRLSNPYTMLRGPVSTGQIIGDMTILTSMYMTAIMSADSVKISSSDLWGNLKIPFVDSYSAAQDWQVPPPGTAQTSTTFSSLIGIPVLNVPIGNSSFVMESSYLSLEHESNEFSRFDMDTYKVLNSSRLGYHLGSWGTKPDNGTWQGYSQYNDTIQSASFALGVDAFVSPFWIEGGLSDLAFHNGTNGSGYARGPAFFKNETGVQTTPTRLKLELEVPLANFSGEASRIDGFMQSVFRVSQHYVESRVNCTRLADDNSQANCRVVANRRSQKPHAPEDITQLSIPLTFSFLSHYLPIAANTASRWRNGLRSSADPSLAYLLNPPIREIMTTEPSDLQGLLNLPSEVLARRLAALLNTFLTLGQTHRFAATGMTSLGEAGINVTAQVINMEERYHVTVEWMSVYVAASVVLLLGGILGTVFAHSALGPEVMGYASSVLRDSKYVELGAENGNLDAVDLTNKLGKKRFKLGFVQGRGSGLEENPLLGVAAEEDVQGLRG